MRPIRTLSRGSSPWIATVVGLTAALFLLACGGEESAPAPEAPAATPEAPAPEAAGKPAAPTPPATAPDTVELAVGDMPEGFPSDLPAFPGAQPLSSMLSPGGSGLVLLSSQEPADQVFAFYKEQLPAQGWSVGEVSDDDMSLKATKGGRGANLKVGSAADHTEISIVLSGS